MEHFSYYNIFDTKGIQYLIIIAFLALMIPFTVILDRKVRKKKRPGLSNGILSGEALRIPQGILHSASHTWAHLSKTGIATVGLDDLILKITGEVGISCSKQPGETVNKGDLLGEITQGGNSLKVYAPISGKVTGINEALSAEPGKINEDPYFSGWICKIRPSNWKYETRDYFLAETAREYSGREL